MALDWSKNGGVTSVALSESPAVTAVSNDIGFDMVFAEQLRWHARTGDILVAISSSGSSCNILNAVKEARKLGLGVISFSGLKPGNPLRTAGDINLYIPARTYGIVECAHQVLLHLWLDMSMGVREWEREDFQDMNAQTFRA
jgi:D-sedoheptulose 7-phosphate isomerase